MIHSKKAQIDNPVILIAVLIVGLLIIAPVTLKIMKSIRDPMSASFGNISNGGDIAQANFNQIIDTGINFWDKIMVLMFFLLIIIMFISAFLVDSHPLFIVLYVISGMMLIIFAPNIIAGIDKIYDSSQFAAETAQLGFMDAVRVHYAEILIGLYVVTGIIIYGKIALFNGAGRRR